MVIEHFILAANSSIDRDRHSLSVFDLLEDLQIQTAEPNQMVPFSLQAVVVIKRDPADFGDLKHDFTIEINGPDGRRLAQQQLPVQMAAAHRRFRLRINMGFPLQASGRYVVRFVSTTIPDLERETDFVVQISAARPQPLQ